MESNEEGEIPLIQEPPLKKTKLLLWLAGGESDGKNTHLITHTLMGEMLTWRFGMSARGVLCFNSLEANTRCCFLYALAGCMLMGILGVGLWQAGGGLYAGTLEEMEVRRDAVLNRAVSKWGEGCQDWGCHHVNGGPSRDLQWWNWHFPDREGDFLFNTSRSWQRSTTFWCPWVWVPHVACQDRTSEMQCGWISKHWYRGSNFPKYWRPR